MEDNSMNQEQPNQNQEYQYQYQNQEYQNPNQNFTPNPNQYQYQNGRGGYNRQSKPFLPSYDVNAFSILALVMGVIAVSSDTFLVGGILAIVFSEMAKKRVRPTDALGIKFAKAGLVLGIISLALFGLSFFSGLWFASSIFSDFWYNFY